MLYQLQYVQPWISMIPQLKTKRKKKSSWQIHPTSQTIPFLIHTFIPWTVFAWDTKGTFHAKMGSIKDRNGMDLTEAEDIKKRWQDYTELYKNDLHNPGNHDGVITHLKPDILECELKWALGNITMNNSSSWAISNPERWCWESAALNMPANLENSAMATGLEKVRFHSNSKERQCQRMLKLPHNCTHLTR